MAPIVYMSRKETFSSAHRLHSPHLSNEENVTIYGKCNNPNGHGHNYEVEVTLRGEINDKTGMVYNLADLKKILQLVFLISDIDQVLSILLYFLLIICICIVAGILEKVLTILDHKNIDKDVPHFQTTISTTENICVFIWNEIVEEFPKNLLHSVTLKETNKNKFCYKVLQTEYEQWQQLLLRASQILNTFSAE